MAGKRKGRVVRVHARRNVVMLQGENYPYEIIRHNHRTYAGSETVDIVRGLSAAAAAERRFNERLTAEEKEAGWSHFAQRTTKKPGPKPSQTHAYKSGGYKR
jgi:hypothetical protein